MLVLRLQRTGRKNVATYRLVCTEKSSPPKGKVKEFLGHYLPTRDPSVFEYNTERIEHWIRQGAQPSDTVARLLTRNGVTGLEKFIRVYTKQKKKKEAPEEKAAPNTSSEAASAKEEEVAKKDDSAEKSG